MSKYCSNCNKTFDNDKVFCTNCGNELVSTNENNTTPNLTEEISVIKNKVIWNVPRGEIAYRISEKEMDSLQNVAGIVVDEGITAHIYVDGKLAAELHGGSYDFINKEELEKKLNARYGGAVGNLSSIGKWLSQLWFGTSINERMESNQKMDKITSMDELVSSIRTDSVYSIILKVDKEFPLVFENDVHTEQYNGTVGLSISAQITNFKQFIQYFTLSEANKNVTNIQVRSLFESSVADTLRHEEFENGKITLECTERISNRLKGKIDNLNIGISVVRINDCTIDSEDLERLRSLNREIYLSGQEIDRLHNMNIIKNRLANEENQQMIEEARTERDIAKALWEINRDKILDDDDMLAFLSTIKNTRVLREARNEDELEQAIAEIKKAKILRETDIDLLIAEINEKKYKTATAFSLMQLRDAIDRDKIVQAAQHDYEERDVTHRRDLESSHATHLVGIEKIKAAYYDERFLVELKQRNDVFKNELEQRKQEYEQVHKEQLGDIELISAQIDIEEKQKAADHARQMEKLQAIQSQQRQMESDRQSHEEKQLQVKANMTSEQLAALQLSQLDIDAQKAFVSASHKDEIAQAQIQAEREKSEFMEKMFNKMQENMQQDKADWKEMAKYSMDSANGNIAIEREREAEYKEDLHREQDRYDRHQEQVTGYMLGKKEEKKAPVQQPAANVQPSILVVPPVAQPTVQSKHDSDADIVVCPKCGKPNNISEGNFCAYCREPLK